MRIVVPIHVAALRVSPSTNATAKTALYDFSALGTTPLSSGGDLIAANRFAHAEDMLNREPGVHLHWSVPDAYTRGAQRNEDGVLEFPTLPNRWLVTRFFQNLNDHTTNVASWILEADAHAQDPAALGASPVTIPWMDAGDDLYGMQYHYVGRRIPLTSPWTEPGSTVADGIAYLGESLQAPLAYGPTFTAYYRQCRNLFGLYDDLGDLFPSANQLENACHFTVSYSVVGWVSPQSSDAAAEALHGAPDVKTAIESGLRWILDDYSLFTPGTIAATQGVVSGTIAGIEWNITSPGNPAYPSAPPDAGSITTAIGNNNPEALSAYVNSLESGESSGDPGSVTANLEWLLNALQFGRLPYLGAGEIGVGQLDEYLHARSFGSQDGGDRWTLRHAMTPGAAVAPKAPIETTLPLPLAKLLSQLNDRQQRSDALADEILTRQQKLFFDWNYHINAIATYVVEGGADIGSDTSGAYLLAGLVELSPRELERGGREPLRIAAPGDRFADLAAYRFNAAPNGSAAGIAGRLLDLFYTLEGLVPNGAAALADRIDAACDALTLALAGGPTAPSYVAQAIVAVQAAQTIAANLQAAIANASGPSAGLAALKAAIDADAAALGAIVDPATGVFHVALPVTSNDPVPTPPGQVYTGRMATFQAFGNAAQWQASGAFPGIGDLLDRLTGQGKYQPHVFDTSMAALHVATAFFWRQSGDTAVHSTPYYLQLAAQEIGDAKADAGSASAALQQAVNALSTDPVSAVARQIGALIANVLPDVAATLTSNPSAAGGALATLRSIRDLRPLVASDGWQAFTTAIETAWLAILDRLPVAQQISLLSTFLGSATQGVYELGSIPAPPYWQPTEPVLLLAQPAGGDLVKPVDRNGSAPLLPCRLETEILKATGSVTWPAGVSDIAARVNPAIPGLAAVVQALVEEAWLIDAHTPPAQLTGVAPDPLAVNAWPGHDDFLPLFIFWEAEYVFSQRVDFASARIPADVLGDFTYDEYLVGYQPQPAAIANFQKNGTSPNFFPLSGVISLSSSVTANLSDQIRNYCTTTWAYDPASGPPADGSPDAAEQTLFYDAYQSFRNLGVLAQGLSGFNAALRQRVQELQLPVNVPPVWTDPNGNNLASSAFWASQFLLSQSAGWPEPWSSQALDPDAFAPGNTAVYFNPLRAGYLQIKTITLVDVFGRFVDVPRPNPTAIAETLESVPAGPLADHAVYLPPRLVQPSRLLGQWISARAPDAMADFTEWNPHPAASPICGWLLPNHLDGSLMIYDAGGAPLGSLGQAASGLRWFTVPGEHYTPGTDNRTLMLNDLASRQANPAVQSFLQTFAYAAETTEALDNFEAFLGVVDRAMQFIITKSMQEDQALAVLVGQPLVLARATVRLQLHGVSDVSLDPHTYPAWNGSGPQFQLDGNGFVPYNFGNFNDGGIAALQVPLRVGAMEYQKDGQVTPYFDDGVVGFFVNEDYATFYTPVNVNDQFLIKSTAAPGAHAASLLPNGGSVTLTLLMDPRAAVHLTTGILPVTSLRIPSDQYAAALERLLVTFLTAPVLQGAPGFTLPVPAETGYDWSWWQVGQIGDRSVKAAQVNTDAVLPGVPPALVDGWLKLRKTIS